MLRTSKKRPKRETKSLKLRKDRLNTENTKSHVVAKPRKKLTYFSGCDSLWVDVPTDLFSFGLKDVKIVLVSYFFSQRFSVRLMGETSKSFQEFFSRVTSNQRAADL